MNLGSREPKSLGTDSQSLAIKTTEAVNKSKVRLKDFCDYFINNHKNLEKKNVVVSFQMVRYTSD